MLQDSPAFSGFSVDNLLTAKQFYSEVLGLKVSEDGMGLTITFGNGHSVFVYHKENHTPASFTILNFPVDDIAATVSKLKAKGVTFEQYPEMTDEDGIAWGKKINMGPDIAWFKDPAGNFLSVLTN